MPDMSRKTPRAEPLAQLRREIESVDRSIVLLLAARLHVAQRAIELRVGTSRRLTDPAQERRVIERGREWARELGVSENMVTQLFRTLVEEGKARFRTAEKTTDAPIVTVFLASPEEVASDRESTADVPFASAPTAR